MLFENISEKFSSELSLFLRRTIKSQNMYFDIVVIKIKNKLIIIYTLSIG